MFILLSKQINILTRKRHSVDTKVDRTLPNLDDCIQYRRSAVLSLFGVLHGKAHASRDLRRNGKSSMCALAS